MKIVSFALLAKEAFHVLMYIIHNCNHSFMQDECSCLVLVLYVRNIFFLCLSLANGCALLNILMLGHRKFNEDSQLLEFDGIDPNL